MSKNNNKATTAQDRPRIGAHVSAAGGLFKAIENGESIGAEAIQIFGLSPRQWAGKLPVEEDAKKFRELHKNSPVKEVFLHAAYLVNLASPNPFILEQSKHSLAEHLKVAEMIDAVGLVFHVGSGKGAEDREAVLRQEVEAMLDVLSRVPGKSFLIMENSAGGGGKVGFGPEEIGYLHKKAKSKRIKVCFDTAHAFEAGLIENFTPSNVKKLWDDWDKHVGLENIIVIHANDSKTAYNSKHDKHENIGAGHIGLKNFKVLAKEKRILDKPWILEVPGFAGEGPDKKNIDILKSLF